MKRLFVAFSTLLVVFVPTVTSIEPARGFDCGAAERSLIPCLGYFTGEVSDPSNVCCIGVKEVKSSAPTKDEQHAACECLKETTTRLPNFKDDRGVSLPKLCGVDVGFTISKNINCNNIP